LGLENLVSLAHFKGCSFNIPLQTIIFQIIINYQSCTVHDPLIELRMRITNRSIFPTLLALLLCACGTQQEQSKNWNDARCFTYTDFIQRIGNKNSTASVLALVGGNMRDAINLSSSAPVHWVDGISGDGIRILVGYTENKTVAGFKDIKGQDLSMADIQRLGPVITKYNNLAQHDPIFQKKRFEASLHSNANLDLKKSFLATPIPQDCKLN
jgi:hypothetical protein